MVVGETGRPGARIQVPYVVDGTPATAELLFDRDTGALRERVIHTDSAVQLTAYLPT